MNSQKKYLVLLLLSFSLVACSQKLVDSIQVYDYSGRLEHKDTNSTLLIGSAASVAFNFSGNKCAISLKSVDSYEHHNFVSLELDGKYIGRLKVEKGATQSYPITISEEKKEHHLTIFKATEASNGGVLFEGTTATLTQIKSIKKKKIEFIGNSITCGMGNDTKEIPCGTGEWYDQHNAYWAYGPILSRSLNADFLLSSVSGIGMYRNWNDEHEKEAIMPDVYENLYLNKDNKTPYDFKFQPDLVSICLGTNDLSDGDGKKPRLPFDQEKYVSNYINFIKMVYNHSPNTRIILLTSPMISGDKNGILVNCLQRVIAAFELDKKHKPITLFQYQPMTPKGCGYHPDIEDHKIMAAQLETTFKKLLDEK
ncbi:GDSL-type esterase/lipase family protein [Flavobacterium sp. SUN052]|uniref:SGNH/GDSL hydrolase family protein n=1 Tax=Flavobacterium sp. SUN052 TaxID=3002441 RepID=UPI00237DDAB3|nr:SGNH/GDSL hydrolase family protein [Flavobacterium sp. SUN052]MEC4005464.1 GDSL-type esterase/lipase family protein [Flavobacterium sp. SUN052]